MILAFLESSRIDSWRSFWRCSTQSSWRRPLQAFEPLASQGCRSACPRPPDEDDGVVDDEDDQVGDEDDDGEVGDEDNDEVGDVNCDRDDGYLALPLQCEKVVLEGPVLLLVRFVLRNIWSLHCWCSTYCIPVIFWVLHENNIALCVCWYSLYHCI